MKHDWDKGTTTLNNGRVNVITVKCQACGARLMTRYEAKVSLLRDREDCPGPTPKRVVISFDGHVAEATVGEHIVHGDGRKYKHEQNFTDMVFLCGPHDVDGSHIEI